MQHLVFLLPILGVTLLLILAWKSFKRQRKTWDAWLLIVGATLIFMFVIYDVITTYIKFLENAS